MNGAFSLVHLVQRGGAFRLGRWCIQTRLVVHSVWCIQAMVHWVWHPFKIVAAIKVFNRLKSYLQLDEAHWECKSSLTKSCTGEWTNPKVFGSLPAPRSGHATTNIEDKLCANLCLGRIVIRIVPKIQSLVFTYLWASVLEPQSARDPCNKSIKGHISSITCHF